LPRDRLLPISASNQVCSEFGVHPELTAVKDLYDDEDLLFFANTGVVSQPVNKDNYYALTKTQLFAHNHMQRETKRVDPYDTRSGTGILGRMSDILTRQGHNVASFSVDRFSVALVGQPGESDSPMIVDRNGVPQVHLDDTNEYLFGLHNSTEKDSGSFAETWSSSLIESLGINNLLLAKLEGINTQAEFPNTYLGDNLETVARLIATRESRGSDVDTFYVEIGGFDTHADVEEALNSRFSEVNGGFEAFAQEMKNINIWNNVTLIQASDFARTLNPNGGDGTDHAWGGNYMMMGGSVKGGKILGKYPDDITEDGPLTLGKGRMIPSTPWDAVFRGIASWVGIGEGDMLDVCPNIHNFNSSFLIDPNEMFGQVIIPPSPAPTETLPTGSPSVSPSDPPIPTKSPTTSPSTSPTKAIDPPSTSPTKSPSKNTSPTKSPSSNETNDPTPGPTSRPTDTPFCQDEEDYFFLGDTTKDCAWVLKKWERRCEKRDTRPGFDSLVLEHCRVSCGTCACANDNWLFQNEVGKDCEWVGKKSDRRCGKTGALDNCRASCDIPCCGDNPDFRYDEDPEKDCFWVAKKSERRCVKDGVDKQCLQACGKCDL